MSLSSKCLYISEACIFLMRAFEGAEDLYALIGIWYLYKLSGRFRLLNALNMRHQHSCESGVIQDTRVQSSRSSWRNAMSETLDGQKHLNRIDAYIEPNVEPYDSTPFDRGSTLM
ncbi:hypothetical protein V6N11_083161 [Hibiscus sabdariffa]|uniref:Uncharacterized protein n=1 Tax=Hibiscus sabdariffa TaxID=183260 RepID=A0ABR2QL29_9ROSI